MIHNDSGLSRRHFLVQAGAAALAATGGRLVRAEKAAQKKPLRVISYNVYVCTGWPKDRAMAKKATALGQMPARLAHELALYEPDIINFSESPSEAVAQEIAERLGMHQVRFPSGGSWPGTVLSRYEILESKNTPLISGERPSDLFTRHWGRATIKLPGGEPLIVHSAHLHPSDQEVRVREITAMLAAMQEDLQAGRSMLLMGDLNHTPTPPEYPLWLDAGWVDTFTQAGAGEGHTIKADRPTKRIDYVLAAGPMAKQVTLSRPLFEGAFRVNNDDPQSFALSDHLPHLAVFER